MARRVHLFTPLRLRGVEFRNRIFVSPMCQYSSVDGFPNQWHLVHLGSRAVGGAGLVMVEATAVNPAGRISPADTGIWSDLHTEAFAPIANFIKQQGAVAGIQLAHAGRKASTSPPWTGGGPVGVGNGGWDVVAPSAVPFAEGYPAPHELDISELKQLVQDFAVATQRSIAAGFQVIEIHMAHGYLLHQFLSPLSNTRGDEYGGSLENRMRFPLEVTHAVMGAVPENVPVFVRISATDWVEGAWDLEQSVNLVTWLKDLGVSLIDCSSGGTVPKARIPVGPGYQTGLAAELKRRCDIPVGAVGLITQPTQAEHILATGQADAVFLARELLRHPYWPLHAARQLGAEVQWPVQYDRARD